MGPNSADLGSDDTLSSLDNSTMRMSFQIAVRLRPVLKKDREDVVILDHIKDSNRMVMHPAPDIACQAAEMTASSQLILQTVSPEAAKTQNHAEYCFDHVFPPETSQDKLYYSLGLPMALSAMESLTADVTQTPRSHVLVSFGVAGSGSTYSSWGGDSFKRKSPADGIVPRILDSLFSQSKHHISKNDFTFGVAISIMQVNQCKEGVKTKEECTVHDILSQSTSTASAPFGFSPSKASNAVRSLVANFERGNTASKISTVLKSDSEMNNAVFIEQDPTTMDFKAVNLQCKTYNSIDSARAAIFTAYNNSRKLMSKKHQSHVVVQMQPTLSRHGKVVHKGGTIAVLDMTGMDQSDKFGRTGAKRMKDTISSRSGAYSAVINCVRTLIENQTLSQECTPLNTDYSSNVKKVPFFQHKLTMLLQPLLSENTNESSVVTLLLNASTTHRDYEDKKGLLNELQSISTAISKLSSMKMNDRIETTSLKKEAHDDTNKPNKSNKPNKPKKNSKPNKPQQLDKPRRDISSVTQRKADPIVRPKRSDSRSASDADDEMSKMKPENAVPQEITRPANQSDCHGVLQAASSLTYSDSSLDENDYVVPMPPPIAPSYVSSAGMLPSFSRRHVQTPEPSAPLWDDSRYVPSISPFYSSPLDMTNMPTGNFGMRSSPQVSHSKDSYGRDLTPHSVETESMCVNHQNERSPLQSTTVLNSMPPVGAIGKTFAASTMSKVAKASKTYTKNMRDRILPTPKTEKTNDETLYVQMLEQRISELESQNRSLNEDVKMLDYENKQLRKQMRLKQVKSPSPLESGIDVNCFSSDEENLECADRQVERYDDAYLNNSLMQHIVRLNNPDNDCVWNKHHKQTHAMSNYSQYSKNRTFK
jgi:Kinesin motor domain